MSRSWLYVLGLMILGSFVTVATGSVLVSILTDIAIFVCGYFIFRRDPYIYLPGAMFFLGCLTIINILYSLHIISHVVSNEALLALVIWSWFGSASKVFRYFMLGAVIYNGVDIYRAYRDFHILDLPTLIVSLGALLLVAYLDRNR